MRVLGLDFSFAYSSDKKNAIVECWLEGNQLEARRLGVLSRPEQLKDALAEPGPWVMRIDFPFGLPRVFTEAVARTWRLA